MTIWRDLGGAALEHSPLASLWRLPAERQALLAYATARLAELHPSPPAHPASDEHHNRETDPPKLPALLHRQTAVQLGGRQKLLALFHEIGASDASLHAMQEHAMPEPDDFLLRHLARQLEARLLAALPSELGRVAAPAADSGVRLHLNLSPESVLGDAFARLAGSCAAQGIALGAEIPLIEAASGPERLAEARLRLAELGVAFVLDAVSPLALALAEPGALGAAHVKLDWAPGLPDWPAPEREAVDAGLARLGPARVVLAGADAEAALRWGVARGIRCFQGAHVEAMLAASRISQCPEASGCTLRQCTERAGAVQSAGRVGCRNPALLDAGAPA